MFIDSKLEEIVPTSGWQIVSIANHDGCLAAVAWKGVKKDPDLASENHTVAW